MMSKQTVAPRGIAALPTALALCLVVMPGCRPSPRTFAVDPGSLPVRSDSSAAGEHVLRVGVLPLANYTPLRDAPERVGPVIAAELRTKRGVVVADAGAVQAALDREPWLLLDRVPPDLVDRLGQALDVDALLTGSVLTYEYRTASAEQVPQVSFSVRLMACPGGHVLWSAVHSRDGDDGEWLFGFGRVHGLEQLAIEAIHEMFADFPVPDPAARRGRGVQGGN